MVGLYTRDRVAAKIMYESIFGPGICTDSPDGSHVTIRFNNMTLELYEGVPKSIAILSAKVPNLNRVREGIEQCFLPLLHGERDRVLFFQDRDGYRWEVKEEE